MTTRRVQRLDELARDIPPARDLWPAISAALQADLAMKAVPGTRRRSAWLPAMGLAASVALVALGVLIGIHVKPDGTTPGSETTAGPIAQPTNPAVIPSAVRYAEYQKQRDQLWTEVEAKLNTMSPAERDKVSASLATLKRSITEIEAALGRDPANALLQELLVNSRQEEMRALTVVRNSGHQEI
jgi:hypothetical protein